MTMIAVILFPFFFCLEPSTDYRLLYKAASQPGESPMSVGYVISIDQCLGESELKRLICQVISREKPASYEMLGISVYHKLDEYAPIQSEGMVRHYLKHMIAVYSWNSHIQGRNWSRLVVAMDSNCQPYGSQSRDLVFDHTTGCQKPAPGNCGDGKLRH